MKNVEKSTLFRKDMATAKYGTVREPFLLMLARLGFIGMTKDTELASKAKISVWQSQ